VRFPTKLPISMPRREQHRHLARPAAADQSRQSDAAGLRGALVCIIGHGGGALAVDGCGTPEGRLRQRGTSLEAAALCVLPLPPQGVALVSSIGPQTLSCQQALSLSVLDPTTGGMEQGRQRFVRR
jgi:hypothetical protein